MKPVIRIDLAKTPMSLESLNMLLTRFVIILVNSKSSLETQRTFTVRI